MLDNGLQQCTRIARGEETMQGHFENVKQLRQTFCIAVSCDKYIICDYYFRSRFNLTEDILLRFNYETSEEHQVR